MNVVEAYFDKIPADKKELALQLRQLVLAAHPGFTEELKWGMPTYACNGNVCYLAVQKNHLNLGFYQGAGLNSTEVKIEGTGKKLRHVKIRSSASLNTNALTKLVQEAVALAGN